MMMMMMIMMMTSSSSGGSCPEDWAEYEDHCYLLVEEYSDWWEARLTCITQLQGDSPAST